MYVCVCIDSSKEIKTIFSEKERLGENKKLH